MGEYEKLLEALEELYRLRAEGKNVTKAIQELEEKLRKMREMVGADDNYYD